MSFLSVLIALLLEQARPLGPGNSIHHSIRVWVRWCAKNFDAGKSSHGWLAWGFAVGGPSLLVLLIYWLLQVFVGWPLALIWSVAVLYATLGFRQFSFHFTQIRYALTDGDEELARRLALWEKPAPAMNSGYWKLYIDHVLQADEGADMDFLVGQRGSAVPKDNH